MIIKQQNKDLRNLMRENHVLHYMVAERLGVSEGTFSKALRKELSHTDKQIVEKAIRAIIAEQIEEVSHFER